MFAVVKTGGKQYKVAKDDVLVIEKLTAEPGEKIQLHDVLMVSEDGKAPVVGTPFVAGAAVIAEVLAQSRGKKVIVFKKIRRQNYRRKRGHRQDQTVLRVLDIAASGATRSEPKAAAKPKAADKATSADKAPAKKAPAKKAASKTTTSKTTTSKTGAKE